METKFILAIAFALQTALATAQSARGRIVDENGNPVYSAAIVQLNPGDSAFIQATVTDSLGRYNLPLKADHYQGIIKISHFAYEDYYLNLNKTDFNKSEERRIALTPKNFELGEVVVKANPPQLRKKADHFSFNVANTDIVKGSDTWKILKLTPFLKVDDISGIEMIGKGQVTVYINGRKNHFSGTALKSYLESLPAEEILDIQIMTSANSRFRAEETGGAINIVLKKNELEGLKGNIAVGDRQSDHDNYGNANAFLNYRKNKVDLTANVFVNENKNYQISDNDYLYGENRDNTIARNRNKEKGINYGAKLNMDYNISDKQILGFMVDASLNDSKVNGNTYNYYKKLDNNRIDSISKTDRNSDIDSYQVNANLNYFLRLNSKDVISADANFLRYKADQERNTNVDILDPQGSHLYALDRIGQRQKQTITNGSAKIDYQLNSLEIFDFKTGLEVYTTRSDADESFTNKRPVNGTYDQNSRFIYTETISAAYAQFSKEWDKFSAMLGARLEYGYGKGEAKYAEEKDFTRDNWDIFPSASVNYSPNDDNNLSLAFSSGIRRPEFVLLNPFRIYTSETVYRENNPFLKNMKTYSLDFTYALKSKYILQINNFHSRNAWSLFRIPDGNNTTREMFDNYGKANILDATLMWNESLFDGLWYVNYSAGGYYGTSNGSIGDTRIDVSHFTPHAYLANYLSIPRLWDLQIMVSYYFQGKEKLASVDREPTHNLGFSVSKQLGNFNVSVGMNDALNWKIRESYAIDGYSYHTVTRPNRRNAWITIAYNWGNQKVKGARNRRVNTEISRRVR